MSLRFIYTALCIMICASNTGLKGASDLPPALSHINEVSDTPPTSEIRLPLRTAMHQAPVIPKITVKRVHWEQATQSASSQAPAGLTSSNTPQAPPAKRICDSPAPHFLMPAVRSSIEIDQRIESSNAMWKKLHAFVATQARETDRLREEVTQLKGLLLSMGIETHATPAESSLAPSSSSSSCPPVDESILQAAREVATVWRETELHIMLHSNFAFAMQVADEFMDYLFKTPVDFHYVPRVLLAKATRYHAETLKARAEYKNERAEMSLEYAIQLCRTIEPMNLSEIKIDSHVIPDAREAFNTLLCNVAALDLCARVSRN